MKYLVIPKILYDALSVYAASTPELNTVQQFLHRCHKRRSHALLRMIWSKKPTGYFTER